MKPYFKLKEERRPKTTISPSDFGKLEADIILKLRDVPETNPNVWTDTLRMAAGKGVEEQMLDILKHNCVVHEDYTQEGDSRKAERNGVPISYRLDAIVGEDCTIEAEDNIMPQGITIQLHKGEPIEVKSINNKNSFDIQKYIDNKPRESYVGQLAIYMDLEGKDRGHLFVSSIDGLNFFWFVCFKREDGLYQCGDTVVDVMKEYERWSEIWKKYQSGEEPNWKEQTYKIPIDSINWTNMSVTAIGDVRNGRKVIGSENSWQIAYSPYKNLIVEKQGATLGYSQEELNIIKEKTAGFSSKKK